jgi:membrane protease YdiL (CAAX protease family)
LSVTPAGGPVGLFQFSIQGRRAPALFVTGWIALILGLGATGVGFIAPAGSSSTVLLGAGLAMLSIGLGLLGGSQTIERAAADRAYAGPSPVLVFAAIVSVTFFVALALGAALELAGVVLDRALGDLVLGIIQAVIFVGVVRFMVVGPGAISWDEMGFRLPLRRIVQAVVGGAVLGAPLVILTGLVAVALVNIFGVTPPSPLPPTGTTSGLVLHLIAGSVVAPVAEEVVFRGFALTAWARTDGARVAIIRSAIFFALAHVLLITGATPAEGASRAIVGGAGRLPIALGLGWLYLRWGTIWAPIGLHATFNAILIVVSELNIGG